MTTGKISSNYNDSNWEDSDFPIVCEKCLGDNNRIRMMKYKYGKECSVCTRPFTVFRWQTIDNHFKVTEICQVCARHRFVCQSCVLDIEYTIPVAVRDKLNDIKSKEAEDDSRGLINVEYKTQLLERQAELDNNPSGTRQNSQRVDYTTIRMLSKIVDEETACESKTRICTFFLKGECGRGEACPFRHEIPTDQLDPVTLITEIKDRYYGTDDEVASRIWNRYNALKRLESPEDKSITTIEIGGLVSDWTKEDAHNYLYKFGEIRELKEGSGPGNWIIQFALRESAEYTVKLFTDWLHSGQSHCSVRWINPMEQSTEEQHHDKLQKAANPQAIPKVVKPKLLPPLPQPKRKNPDTSNALTDQLKRPRFVPGPSHVSIRLQDSTVSEESESYPSQDPERLGNKIH